MKALAIVPPFARSLRLSPLAKVRSLLALRRSRQDLAELPDHLIRDIGLTREAVVAEATRPFWDAPDHWKRLG